MSQSLRDAFWLQGMQAGFKAVLDCIKAFSETDFTDDLKKMDVPTLIMHGDDDQIVPPCVQYNTWLAWTGEPSCNLTSQEAWGDAKVGTTFVVQKSPRRNDKDIPRERSRR